MLSDIPLLDITLSNIPGILSLDRLLQQANAQYPLGVFILFSCVLILVGFLLFSVIIAQYQVSKQACAMTIIPEH